MQNFHLLRFTQQSIRDNVYYYVIEHSRKPDAKVFIINE